ncbi:MAG TPA: Wzz/FepE/Etk N-terminal domain-containing protein [Bacteroidia bacterium]|jgi:uncharacterized protein involved in exopolysaccharide biosynthesis|nr:Wzz/FepE/Etk N-terminal domain-containing protein [Bacteroidia bacterium]
MLNQNIGILKKLYKKRKHIILATLVTITGAFVACYFIKPSYKSTAVVYPTNLSVYSEESQTEQLLQFFQSSEIRQYMMKKYNLCAHYGIDTTKKKYLFTYEEIFDKKVSIKQTKYESIEINVEDHDPDSARIIAGGVIDAVNWLIEKEHREKYMETVKNARVYLEYKKHEVDSTQKILTELSEKYGLLNISVQLKEAAKNEYKLWTTGGKNAELSNLIESMNKYGVEQGKLAVYFDDQLRGWAWANNDFQKRLAEYHHHTTFTSLASKPTRPVMAAWPKRTLIMIVSGTAMFILSCIYFIFVGRIKLIYEQITTEK